MTIDFTKAEDIKELRRQLGLSQKDFGQILGIDSEKGNQDRLVRRWESGKLVPSGPVRQVMIYLSQGVAIGKYGFDAVIPDFILDPSNETMLKFLYALKYPRFIAMVTKSPEMGIFSLPLNEEGEHLALLQVIDASSREKLLEAFARAMEYVITYA